MHFPSTARSEPNDHFWNWRGETHLRPECKFTTITHTSVGYHYTRACSQSQAQPYRWEEFVPRMCKCLTNTHTNQPSPTHRCALSHPFAVLVIAFRQPKHLFSRSSRKARKGFVAGWKLGLRIFCCLSSRKVFQHVQKR